MRILTCLAVVCFIGCQQTPAPQSEQLVEASPVNATLLPTAARSGGDIELMDVSDEGAVRQPVLERRVVAAGTTWEYDVVLFSQLIGAIRDSRDDAVQEALRNSLNEWGAQGWELVEVAGETYIFKRPGRGF